MKTISTGRLAAVAMVAALLPAGVWILGAKACGPDFEPEVFVPEHRPESPKLFASGQLGVVHGTYFHADLVVAYRYLSGGRLSEAEQAAYTSAYPSNEENSAEEVSLGAWEENSSRASAAALAAWQKARAAVAPGTESPAVSEVRTVDRKVGTYTFHGDELNCTDGAFTTAAATLNARAQMWGASSANVKNWLRGQDAVFSNCAGAGTIPEAAEVGWPLLLRQDRAYQIAAAEFYAGQFDDAIAGFEAIGKDKASPWSRWGDYLAARGEVRKASYSGKTADFGEKAVFDEGMLRAAETRLHAVLAGTKDVAIQHAAQSELNFVEVRLEPEQRLVAAANALTGPKADADFGQDAVDLDWLIDAHPMAGSELVQWIMAMRGADGEKGSPGTSAVMQRLQQNSDKLPWLVAALSRQPPGAAEPEILRAAASVPVGSPGYSTVSFYRAQAMVDAGRASDARALTTSLLAGFKGAGTASIRSQFLSVRIQTSRNLGEFLADAPRSVLGGGSGDAEMARCQTNVSTGEGPCSLKLPNLQFDGDAAGYMDREMPLEMLEQAAESQALPPHLRLAVAEVAWVRALGLGDAAAVQRMAPLLPAPVRAIAGTSSGFPATLALLHNPGLKPFLLAGVQRSASFGEMDHFRDNWWCGRWTDGGGAPGYIEAPLPETSHAVAFLSAQEKLQAMQEGARLNASPAGLVWVGQRAIAYVKAHPDDKNAAETLALVVQGTHWGCDMGERVTVDPVTHETSYGPATTTYPQRALSKEAFEMLHRMYPKSVWAAKTKYYY